METSVGESDLSRKINNLAEKYDPNNETNDYSNSKKHPYGMNLE